MHGNEYTDFNMYLGGSINEFKISYYGYDKKCEKVPITYPPQQQYRQPGLEYIMVPRPIYDNPNYKGTGKQWGANGYNLMKDK